MGSLKEQPPYPLSSFPLRSSLTLPEHRRIFLLTHCMPVLRVPGGCQALVPNVHSCSVLSDISMGRSPWKRTTERIMRCKEMRSFSRRFPGAPGRERRYYPPGISEGVSSSGRVLFSISSAAPLGASPDAGEVSGLADIWLMSCSAGMWGNRYELGPCTL